MTDLQLNQKLIKVKNSCKTPEQRSAFERYYELYTNRKLLYQSDLAYRRKVDLFLLIITSLVIWLGIIGGFIWMVHLLNK